MSGISRPLIENLEHDINSIHKFTFFGQSKQWQWHKASTHKETFWSWSPPWSDWVILLTAHSLYLIFPFSWLRATSRITQHPLPEPSTFNSFSRGIKNTSYCSALICCQLFGTLSDFFFYCSIFNILLLLSVAGVRQLSIPVD